jgi:ketosteroid isomerase-like protein
MKESRQNQIIEAEESLRKAMLESDVIILNQLLSPNLIFTNHLGQVLGKKDDLDAHKSGLLNITDILVENQQIKLQQDTAIVFAKVTIHGNYNGNPANGTFRFTRVWQNIEETHWEVIAAHSSVIAI